MSVLILGGRCAAVLRWHRWKLARDRRLDREAEAMFEAEWRGANQM